METFFTIRVEFHDSTAYENIGEVLALVESFNQQANLDIDWSASLHQGTSIANLQFRGKDEEGTVSCAQFVCETINQGNKLPLVYTRTEESDNKIILH